MKYSVAKKNNAIINIVARFQLQKRVYDIVLFLQIRNLFVFPNCDTVYWNFILCFENTKRQ